MPGVSILFMTSLHTYGHHQQITQNLLIKLKLIFLVLFVTLKIFVALFAVSNSVDYASVPHQGLVVGANMSAITSAGQIENNTTPRK